MATFSVLTQVYSAYVIFTHIQQLTLTHPPNLIQTAILLRAHYLSVIASVSHLRLVQWMLRITRNIMFQDTAPPLTVKDGRSILAFYSFRLDTNIKLAVS